MTDAERKKSYGEISKQFYKSAKNYSEFKKRFKNIIVGGDLSGTQCVLSDRKSTAG